MRVTVRELIGAGDLTDKLAFAGALYASYYLGGTIGSLMVAGDAFFTCKVGPGRHRACIKRCSRRESH